MAEVMATPKKKPAPKAQRASKAKGLVENVGTYKDKKALNLRDKQLGKAGVKAASVRGGKLVSISKTKYNKDTKKVTGPLGKPLTGKVDMGGGNIAVYKDGKRVVAKKAAVKKATPPRPPSPPKGPTVKPLTAAQKAAILKDKSKSQGKSPKAGKAKTSSGVEGPKGASDSHKSSTNKKDIETKKNRNYSKPERGGAMQLVRDKNGIPRWVKVVKKS